MNYKRGKPRRKVRCGHCTSHRMGNSKKAYSLYGGEVPSVADRRAEADLEDGLADAQAIPLCASCGSPLEPAGFKECRCVACGASPARVAWPQPSQEARAAATGQTRTRTK